MLNKENFSLDQEKINEIKNIRQPLVEAAAKDIKTCLLEDIQPQEQMEKFDQIVTDISNNYQLSKSEIDEDISLVLKNLSS